MTSEENSTTLKRSSALNWSKIEFMACFVCWILVPAIDPLVSRTKMTCFGRVGSSEGAKKWTKYPSTTCCRFKLTGLMKNTKKCYQVFVNYVNFSSFTFDGRAVNVILDYKLPLNSVFGRVFLLTF